MTTNKYLNNKRLFVDSFGKAVHYKVHTSECMLYLEIETGCHHRGTIRELFDFLQEMKVDVTVTGSNWKK